MGDDAAVYPAYLIRDYAHLSQVALASVGSLILLFAPIAQLLVFLTVTPRFGMVGAFQKVSGYLDPYEIRCLLTFYSYGVRA